MTSPARTTPSPPDVPSGVRYARWAGYVLAWILIGLGLQTLLRDGNSLFDLFKGGFFTVFGVFLNLPFSKLPAAGWKWAYGILVFLAAAFVFVLIASVMFDYMEAAAAGERLGVPGFEGSLVFLSLMQVPAVLFERRPDLLD